MTESKGPMTLAEAKVLLADFAGAPWTPDDVIVGETGTRGFFFVKTRVPDVSVSNRGIQDFHGRDVSKGYVVSRLVEVLYKAKKPLPWERELNKLRAATQESAK
jgi:hypothetical protein